MGALSLVQRVWHRLGAALERRLPEQRLFLKSDSGTRFIRLRPWTQATILCASAFVIAWTIIATGILMIDSIGSGSAREQARLSLLAFEDRLDALSKERDLRAAEAAAAQQRFTVALDQVSRMQSTLLASEERRRELETGIGLIQTTLRAAMGERDSARSELAALSGDPAGAAKGANGKDLTETLTLLTSALGRTAAERDTMARAADSAQAEVKNVAYEMRLLEDRHNEIFAQLEDAVTISMEPLDKMFASVGIDPKDLIDNVRRGYSGQGGPLGEPVPASLPASDSPAAKADYDRASKILDGLDRMNLYRIAVEQSPLAMPLKTSYRLTSSYGSRWGRAHAGIDLAGAYASPIYATGDGVVTYAGTRSGYGIMVEIQHPSGFVTRFAHMSKARVETGQKVSRGDLIGDMGSTGRSTGNHLHYEVRADGKALNPMTFIKAATNVF